MKNLSRCVLAVAMSALVLTAVNGQEVSQKDFDEFSEMFTGRWVGKVKWVADWPGLAFMLVGQRRLR